jgi:hypothetical protein
MCWEIWKARTKWVLEGNEAEPVGTADVAECFSKELMEVKCF